MQQVLKESIKAKFWIRDLIETVRGLTSVKKQAPVKFYGNISNKFVWKCIVCY